MKMENGSFMGAGSSDRIVAADRITIYSQDSAWEGIGYSGSTLKEYGCGLFTVHHAMEWVGVDPVPSPAAMAETDRKRGFFSNEASYFIYMEELTIDQNMLVIVTDRSCDTPLYLDTYEAAQAAMRKDFSDCLGVDSAEAIEESG